jgi:CRISPR/Cas system-associated exonuclease Cas4 (RecB family)
MCTQEAYEAACEEFGVDPSPDAVEYLGNRMWQQRVPIVFRDGELEETGRNLITAAKLIGLLDTGELEPLRNAKPSTCNGCPFRDVCDDPNEEVVDLLFERRPPKRDRDISDLTRGAK